MKLNPLWPKLITGNLKLTSYTIRWTTWAEKITTDYLKLTAGILKLITEGTEIRYWQVAT
jgi:hypothetical protein